MTEFLRRWRDQQKWSNGWIPISLTLCYFFFVYCRGNLGALHAVVGGTVLALSFGNSKSRAVLSFFFPFLIGAIYYDLQRYLIDYIRQGIWVVGPYELEKKIFGVHCGEQICTLNEWFQLHTSTFLDLLTGAVYILFHGFYLGLAVLLHFFLTASDPQKQKISSQLLWAYLFLTVLGNTSFAIWGTAPPWYVAAYGLGPARMDILPSPAGGLRFDQLTGLPIFRALYQGTNTPFGAIPSLHAAYPTMMTWFCFRLKKLFYISLTFTLLTFFSAIYLDHHYLIDLITGALYGSAAALFFIGLSRSRFFKFA